MRRAARPVRLALSAGAGLGAGASALLFWALVVEPRLLEFVRLTGRVPGLPAAWEGRRLGLLADLQLGMVFGNDATARRAVEELRRARPAAVLLAGDFILHTRGDPSRRIARACSVVAPLPESGIDCYAVLGNHDYGQPGDPPRAVPVEERVAEGLRRVGVRVLENEAVRLRAPGRETGDDFYLVAIGPRRPGRDDPAAAFAGVPPGAPRVTLLHNPESFRDVAPGAAPLAFAGHTHGGQVNLLGFLRVPLWMRLLGSRRDLRHGAGWVEDVGQAGNHLYVSRGIGFSRYPLRLNAPPEVTLIALGRG